VAVKGVTLATARILSIDDSPTVLKLIEMIGQAAGYEVHVANDGRRGVEMAVELHPDVILVDFIMPEMNGLQVCKALHDNPETRGIPIILVSSKGEAVGDKFVATLGVRHYCTKPFKAEELLAKLSEILGEQTSGAPEVAVEQAAAEPEPEVNGQPVILSIDDSPTILRLVEMILANAGFTVRTAAGGAKGIELARQLHPDVVLVDFIMPEVNGFQVSKTLREDPATADIPIILVSSKGEAVGEQFVQTLGIHHYLTKPFQPDQLVAEVRTALQAGVPATVAGSTPTPTPTTPSLSHEEAVSVADARATGATGDDDAVGALRSHLDAQLAAMEERLITILDRRLQEVVEEIRNRAQVGSR